MAALGWRRYLSVLATVDVVLGNSSSGIIEAPSFGIATVNVGDRQTGRLRAASVIDCPGERAAIEAALTRALDPAFRDGLASLENPFGDGHAAERICRVLCDLPAAAPSAKPFHDLDLTDMAFTRPPVVGREAV